MARIPESKLFEIQQANDIVDVVTSYLPLKRSGSNYKACCPFHEEKTPSFMVSRTKQIFKCFGCGVGGNVFSFVQSYEKCSWVEAVTQLAERAGIKLKLVDDPDYEKKRALKTRLFEVNEWAAGVYEETFRSSSGRAALKYMGGRGFSGEILDAYRVGYAPAARGFLIEEAQRKGIDPELLVKAGLAIVGDSGRLRDKFYNRMMIPIFDLQGRAIGFGGRILGDGEPKYLNSPETPVFSKRHVLFDLQRARDAIRREGRVAVVEGYTDCMKLRQAGIEYVVAQLGTALTVEHVRLLKRFADNIILFYDADIAGLKAAERGLDVFFDEDVDVKIACLPEGQDPDDLVSGPEGSAAFREVEREALDLVDFKLKLASDGGGLEGVAARKKAVDAMLETLAGVSSPVKATFYIQKIGQRLGLKEEDLRGEFKRLRKRRRSSGVADTTETGPAPAEVVEVPLAVARAERGIIEIALHKDSLINVIEVVFGRDAFAVGVYSNIFKNVIELFRREGRIIQERLMALLEDADAVSIVAELSDIEHGPDFDWNEYMEDCVGTVENYRARRKAEDYRRRMAAQSDGQSDKDELVLGRVRELSRKHETALRRRLADAGGAQ